MSRPNLVLKGILVASSFLGINCSDSDAPTARQQIERVLKQPQRPTTAELTGIESIFDIPFTIDGHEVIFRRDFTVQVDGQEFACESLHVNGIDYSAKLMKESGSADVCVEDGICFKSFLGKAVLTEDTLALCARSLKESPENTISLNVSCHIKPIPVVEAAVSLMGSITGRKVAYEGDYTVIFKRNSSPPDLQLTQKQ